MKLFKQVHWDKAEEGVLGGADAVALVTLGDAAVLILVRALAGNDHAPFARRLVSGCVLTGGPVFLGGRICRRVPAQS